MRKLAGFLSAIILITAALLVTPWVIGFYAQKDYEDRIELASSPTLKIANTEYHRGWFRSEAVTEITVLTPEQVASTTNSDQPITIKTKEEIYHGPIIFRRDEHTKKLDFFFGQALIYTTASMGADNAIAKTFVSYMGNTNTQMHHANFAFVENGASIQVHDMNIDVSTLNFNQHITSNISVGSLETKDKESNTEISNVNIMSNIRRYNPFGLWLGEHSMSIDKLSLNKGSDKNSMQINKFYLSNMSSERAKKFIDNLFKLNIETVEYKNKTSGPIRLNFSINNIDGDAAMKLQHEAANANKNKEMKRQVMQNIMNATVELFAKGLQLNLSTLEVNTPQGKLLADGQLQIPTQKPGYYSLFNLILAINGNANVTVSKQIFKNYLANSLNQDPNNKDKDPKKLAENEITKMKKEGWLTEKGESYLIQLEYKDGRFLVNGKQPEFSIPQPIEKLKDGPGLR